MKRQGTKRHMDGLLMLLLFGVFAVCVLIVLLTGARAYRGLTDRDRAVARCQSAAEALRHSRGDLKKTAELLGLSYPHEGDVEVLSLGYDKDWNSFGVVQEVGKDVLRTVRIAPVDSGVDGLGRARIEALEWDDGGGGEARPIYAIEVCWQESEAVTASGAGVEIDDGTD